MHSNIPNFTKPENYEGMRKAGKLAAETLDYLTDFVKPGVTTVELNDIGEKFIRDHHAIPAPLNYEGPPGAPPYPKAIPISPNHVICHGIPSDKMLKNGDITNIDITVILDGWYDDTSRMFFVGDKINVKAQKLVQVTYDALMKAIDIVRPGVRLGDIGNVIQTYAESQGFSVVRDFCGHGLGREFHTPPSVLHFGRKGEGAILEEGTFFTIEPMINIGKPDIRMLPDDWTAVTKDKSLSAQFEHSLGITKDGCEIFTLSPKGYTQPPY